MQGNIGIMREGAKWNLNVDALDTMFAVQANGVMFTTKSELPASLMTTYLSMEFDVSEVVVSTRWLDPKSSNSERLSCCQKAAFITGAGYGYSSAGLRHKPLPFCFPSNPANLQGHLPRIFALSMNFEMQHVSLREAGLLRRLRTVLASGKAPDATTCKWRRGLQRGRLGASS